MYFKSAEKYLKIVERKKIIDGPDIASINELSNAAFFTIGAMVQPEIVQQKALLDQAIDSCNKSSFQALKLGIIDKAEKIINTHEAFHKDEISCVIDDWTNILSKTKKLVNKLKIITDSGVNESDYEYACKSYEDLCVAVGKVDIYESYLNEKKKKRIINDRTFWALVIFNFVTLVMNIIITFVKMPIK